MNILVIILTLTMFFALGFVVHMTIERYAKIGSKSVIPSLEPLRFKEALRQAEEDCKMENAILKEAHIMFDHWIEGKIVIANPRIGYYLVHDQSTAKYLNKDINVLIKEEFEKLKIAYSKFYI